MSNASLNGLIYEKLEEQVTAIREQLTRPVFQQYAELLKMHHEGQVMFSDSEGIEELLIEKANDIGAANEYAAFMESNIIDEAKAVTYLTSELRSCFTVEAAIQQFSKSGAISFSYDWYFHYDSGINFSRNNLATLLYWNPAISTMNYLPIITMVLAKAPIFQPYGLIVLS